MEYIFPRNGHRGKSEKTFETNQNEIRTLQISYEISGR